MVRNLIAREIWCKALWMFGCVQSSLGKVHQRCEHSFGETSEEVDVRSNMVCDTSDAVARYLSLTVLRSTKNPRRVP